MPNPLSRWLHFLPREVLRAGVMVNHVVELGVPLLSIISLRHVQYLVGMAYVAFQLLIIASGNLSFLNHLTILPALFCFDDAFFLFWLPCLRRRWEEAALDEPDDTTEVEYEVIESASRKAPLADAEHDEFLEVREEVIKERFEARYSLPRPHRRRTWLQLVLHVSLLCTVAYLSIAPVQNLLDSEQSMNRSFDVFRIVNTYGAFGSVGIIRQEVVVKGTNATEPTRDALWLEYEFPCKPGDPTRNSCIAAPYHYRLSWQLW